MFCLPCSPSLSPHLSLFRSISPHPESYPGRREPCVTQGGPTWVQPGWEGAHQCRKPLPLQGRTLDGLIFPGQAAQNTSSPTTCLW